MDGVSVLSSAPWTLPVPSVRLQLTTFKEDATDPVTCKQFYFKRVFNYPAFQSIVQNDGVAAAAVTSHDY